jgi:hypothetical protein
MKVAIFCESDQDSLALRILVDAILAKPTEPVGLPFRAEGWEAVRSNLSTVLNHLHYRTDADALVIAVDADDSPLHLLAHEQPNAADGDCRLCCLCGEINRVSARLKPLAERALLKCAVGLAVPSLEAWLLCGKDGRATEAAWQQGGTNTVGSDQRKELKRLVYGSSLTSRQAKAQRMREEASRLAQDLSLLETYFPLGFGALARAIRSW